MGEDRSAGVKSGRGRSGFRENAEAVLIAVLLAMFIRTFVVQAFKIPSGSMLDTLKIGDHILVNKFVYGLEIPFLQLSVYDGKHPERGDIVVFKYPEDPQKDFIKRVVAVGGDVLEIKDKQVYVNQERIEENYIVHADKRILPSVHSPRDNLAPVRIPEGSLFVMGDNRDNSHDSRFWGVVDEKDILGSAFMIYWSWNARADSLPEHVRWGRIGDIIQ